MKNERLNPQIGQDIIEWFKNEGRQLPWRETRDPYAILVSEIMLQQTQVATVIPYYLRFMETLPTIDDLAHVSEEVLHSLWEGLGYYSRASRLRQFAIKVVHDYKGIIPDDKVSLIKLPGIGPYTLGALLSFAFDKKEPAVDGNVKRVLARLMADSSDISKMTTTKAFTLELTKILPQDIYSFNQGIIELGALVCKPKKPDCDRCPIHRYCKAFEQDLVEVLPNKPKKIKQTKLRVPIFIIEDGDLILFVKRESKGLLSGLFGLPMVEVDTPPDGDLISFKDYMLDTFDYIIDENRKLHKCGEVKHVFSHRIWLEQVYCISLEGLKEKTQLVDYPEIKWSKTDDISLPTAFRKALELWDGKGKDETS